MSRYFNLVVASPTSASGASASLRLAMTPVALEDDK